MRERAKIVVIARACAVILLELAVRLLRYYFPRLRVCRRYCPSVCCAVAMPPSASDEMIVSRSFFIKVSFRLIDMYVFFCHAALPPCRHCHARCAGVRVVFPSSSVGCGGRVSRVTPTSLQCVSCSRPFVCRRMQGAGVSWSVSVSLANLQKNMKAHRQIVVFFLSPVQNLSLRRVFANVLGPAAPLGACAKWRLSVAKCRFGIAGWHFLAAKGTNFGAIMYRLATVFRLASVRPPHRVYRVRR